MKARINSAHVLALIAIVLALGGNAVAFTLGKNSVGTKQLKRNAVTKQKVRKNAINGSKVKNNSLTGADINLSKLGTVPSAQNATTAGTANTANVANAANTANAANIADSLAPAEGWHEIGAPGEPGFESGFENLGGFSTTAAFYKDQAGIVHLKGDVYKGKADFVFRLPPGYRPTPGKYLRLSVHCSGVVGCTSGTATALIYGSAVPGFDGLVTVQADAASLDGISFRAES